MPEVKFVGDKTCDTCGVVYKFTGERSYPPLHTLEDCVKYLAYQVACAKSNDVHRRSQVEKLMERVDALDRPRWWRRG